MNNGMRKIVIALIFVFAFLFVFIVKFENLQQQINSIGFEYNTFAVDKVLPSVVKIKARCEYNSWQGSGIFIRDNMILTAGHVTDEACAIEVITDSNEIIIANSWYTEDTDITDLGIIIVDTENVEPTMRFNDAVLGEAAFALGNPYGIFPYLSVGIISSLNVDDDFFGEKNLIMSDCPLNPGSSGCAIFNIDGEILGIAVGGIHASDGIGFIIPSKVCKAVIEKYESIKKLEGLE